MDNKGEGVGIRKVSSYELWHIKDKRKEVKKKILIVSVFVFLVFVGTIIAILNLISKRSAQWEWVVKPGVYKNISFLEGDLFKAYKNNGEACIIDASTKKVYKYPLFDDIDFDRENVFIVKKNDLYFYVDKTGNRLSDKNYENIYSLKNGLSAAKLKF